MVKRSPFGVRLWRLLSSGRPSFELSIEDMVAELTREAGVGKVELSAVVDGAEPTAAIVRKLGPALGIHTADMFVLAGLPVPSGLASAWPTSPWDVGSLVEYAVELGSDQRSRLDEVVRTLPVRPRTDPVPADDYPEGPGALPVLRSRPWPGTPDCLAVINSRTSVRSREKAWCSFAVDVTRLRR